MIIGLLAIALALVGATNAMALAFLGVERRRNAALRAKLAGGAR